MDPPAAASVQECHCLPGIAGPGGHVLEKVWGALLAWDPHSLVLRCCLPFALGSASPVGLGAVAIGWLEHLRPLSNAQRAFEIAGGVPLVLLGLYLLNAYFFILPSLAA